MSIFVPDEKVEKCVFYKLKSGECPHRFEQSKFGLRFDGQRIFSGVGKGVEDSVRK
jgi:hypothetical protein